MNRKHLLILGAGASMSLVPKEIKEEVDINADKRLLSGYDLVQYIYNYSKKLFLMILAIHCKYKFNGSTYGTYQLLEKCWDFSENGSTTKELAEKYKLKSIDDNTRNVLNSIINLREHLSSGLLKETLHDYELKQLSTIVGKTMFDHIYKLNIASCLVAKYAPLSIDYFANNLEFFAGNDINHFVVLGIFNDLDDAIIQIQKYLKIIICEILNEKQMYTIEYAKNSSHQNYIRQIIWNMALEANREGEDVKTYIENNLDVITFNYDVTIDTLLKEYQNLSVNTQSGVFLQSNSINETQKINIIHVYSYIGAGNGQLGSLPEINLAKAILSDSSSEFENILKKCNNYIFWIRNTVEDPDSKITKENTQSLCLELIKNADNIYFLGFGFDKNNLENIGFVQPKLNEAGIKRYKGTIVGKRIFVSKTTGKINDILMQIIKGINHEDNANNVGDDTKLNTRMGDSTVYVSDVYNQNRSTLTSFNYIGAAFERDFDI